MTRDENEEATVATTRQVSPTTTMPAPATSQDLLHQQLLLAMSLTDVIRRHEDDGAGGAVSSSNSSSSSTKQPEAEDSYLQKLLTTPGVRQGCFTLIFGTAVAIPTRRWILQKTRRSLGTIFPDLVTTPILTLLTAQCTLLVGAFYGSAVYLDRLAQIPVTAPSRVADVVCHDIQFVEASRNSLNLESSTSSNSNSSWDPRTSTVEAMKRAVQSCRERRDIQRQQAGKNSEEEERPRSSIWSRIKWWN